MLCYLSFDVVSTHLCPLCLFNLGDLVGHLFLVLWFAFQNLAQLCLASLAGCSLSWTSHIVCSSAKIVCLKSIQLFWIPFFPSGLFFFCQCPKLFEICFPRTDYFSSSASFLFLRKGMLFFLLLSQKFQFSFSSLLTLLLLKTELEKIFALWCILY